MNNKERMQRIGQLNFDYNARDKTIVNQCNLCGSFDIESLGTKDRYGFPVSSSFCKNCGLVFLNPRMTSDEYVQFYEKYYRPLVSAYYGRTINAQSIQEEQLLYANELIGFLGPYKEKFKGGNLIDIGGSTGVVASKIAAFAEMSATCLDPSPDELSVARERGCRTICSLLEDYNPSNDEKYDLVTVCQTVDHFLDIFLSLKKISTTMKPNGYMFIDMVNFLTVSKRNKSYIEAIKVDHPFYLTPETLKFYLDRTGFNVIDTQYNSDGIHVGFLTQLSSITVTGVYNTNKYADSLIRELREI